jgi:transposase
VQQPGFDSGTYRQRNLALRLAGNLKQFRRAEKQYNQLPLTTSPLSNSPH